MSSAAVDAVDVVDAAERAVSAARQVYMEASRRLLLVRQHVGEPGLVCCGCAGCGVLPCPLCDARGLVVPPQTKPQPRSST